MFLDEEIVNDIKERYPEGTRIVLDYMGKDPHPIEPGTRGTVRHVDDIVTGIENMLCNPPKENELGDRYKIYNIGNHKPEQLMHFIEVLEKALGKTAEKEYLPMQPGDVYQTYADVSELQRDFDFTPETTIEEGLGKFAQWYKSYYKV